MKKFLFLIAIALATPVMTMNGQTYDSLWKEVEKAVKDDLPQTEQKWLRRIAQKAEKERDYGQLLKAELQEARSLASVSPDSLLPAVNRLKNREEQAADDALRAVYNTVLGTIYNDNATLDIDNHETIAAAYYDKALVAPEKLAGVKATAFQPLVVTHPDSKYFGHDLLSVIGYETQHFLPLRDYYLKSGNRPAALFASLEMLKQERPDEQCALGEAVYIQRLDSLIAEYGDLDECCEVAIERYDYMNEQTDATAEQKYHFLTQAQARWRSWRRASVLANRKKDITFDTFRAQMEHRVNIPGRSQTIELTGMRGINTLTMRIYQVKADGTVELNPSATQDYKKIRPLLKVMPQLTQTRHYNNHQPYEVFSDSVVLEGLPVGVYMIEMETMPATEVSRQLYFVSDLRLLVQGLPDQQIRYVAVNATTGQPVKGARLQLTSGYGRSRTTTTVTTDSRGEHVYTYRTSRPNSLYVSTVDDKACPPMNGGGYFSYYEAQDRAEHIAIYTDRNIYRPGQTVHVAAIAYTTRHGFDNEVKAGQHMRFVLRDANYQTVAEQTTVANEYGTASADFTLPSQGLSGQFSVNVEGHSQYFRVEEYKRPTFEVAFDQVNQHYADGDTVTAKATAKTYAGIPVQGAQVQYKVVRRKAFWWVCYSRYWDGGEIGMGANEEVMAEGESTTEADGSFTVAMPMILPKTKHPMFYNFVVTADVTDQGGETHHGELSLPLGNRRTAFSTTLPDRVLAEDVPQVTFNLRNAAGNDIEATLRYRIDQGQWHEAKTNSALTLIQTTMKSGRHTLQAVCLDDTLERDFVVFSLDDKRPAATTDDWFYVSAQQFANDRQPVTVQVGSSAKDVHVVYTLLAGNTVIEQGATDISNQLINRKITYKEEYGNGLLLTYAWIKDGRTYTHQATIKRPLPDKQLKMQWKTFRNRLTPGQSEEWTLTVTQPDGKPANAQLMATLYDKSLDQLSPHQWQLSPSCWLPVPSANWTTSSWGGLTFTGHNRRYYDEPEGLQFSVFDHELYPSSFLWHRNTRMVMASARMNRVAKAAPQGINDDGIMYETMMVSGAAADYAAATEEAEMDEAESGAIAGGAGDNNETAVQLRENLNETAFFYPQLSTDSQGQVALKFILPECLTTWRFMGIAHTRDMMYGTMTDEVVARKDVMIQPNMPRFLRMGDKATVTARIFNTGETAVSGTARMQLINPENEQAVMQGTVAVAIAPDSTAVVTFDCMPDESWPTLLIAKVTVSGDDFSDGEQHYLPILPNRERVTVSVPFTQNVPGTKTIDLAALLPQDAANNPQITIEYTNNPAWLMIQALPAVGQPSDDNAISQAASLYANAIGRHIISQNPNAKGIFEAWKRENGQETSLMSSLEKDTELKDLLLNETPWVMDANRETEQKQRLADFFDENMMAHRQSSAIAQLDRLQQGNGAWSWWKGMPASFYMTVEISEMLVRLNQMTSEQQATKHMLNKAFDYMGQEIVKLVDEMKKEEKKGHKQVFPSHKALQWLYICTIDGRQLPGRVQEANNYLKNLLKKETKNQTIYDKAMSAIVLGSKTYIKSLKEYTVYKEEMGRYYDTQRALYSWRDYRIPTQVAAIEALQRLTPEDTQTIDEMRRWLLQEKRTQAWDTPINSTDAIYAFLNGNANELKAQDKTVLKVDGTPVETSAATAGIGYVKTTIPAKDVHTFTAEKTSAGTSWGAVYAQFMQQTSHVSDRKSGISVRRELLTTNNEKPTALHIGDRIKVRLTIQADRDYDFVQVIDKRAACLEPVNQLSGYHYGYYRAPKDYTTNYYFDMLPKGKHIIETEYYVDRAGTYETGTCTAECAYSPEFRGLTKSQTITVNAQ